MKRRKKLIDPEAARRAAAEAEEARRALERERAKVQRSTPDILGEIKEHRRLLKENNFARRISKALGGAGG